MGGFNGNPGETLPASADDLGTEGGVGENLRNRLRHNTGSSSAGRRRPAPPIVSGIAAKARATTGMSNDIASRSGTHTPFVLAHRDEHVGAAGSGRRAASG